jgi:hypothetical protein
LWLWVALLAVITVTLAVHPTTVGGLLGIALTTAAVTTLLTSVTFKLLRLRAEGRLRQRQEQEQAAAAPVGQQQPSAP